MRIGIVTTWFERGAAYVSKQYENILEKNNEVYIYARGGEMYARGNPLWDKDNVHWGKKNTLPIINGLDLSDFQKWLEKNNIELVLFNEQWWWQPILLCKKLNIITGAYIDYYTDTTVPLFANYDFLICNTKRHFSVFNWHPKCFYVPWGTDTNLFKMDFNEKNNDTELIFFHSAGMNPFRKGTDFTILAFNTLVKKYDNIKLLIHTQKNISDYFPDLNQTIHSLQADKKLDIVHESISAPGLYHKADVYIYPSRLDGIGLTLMEAMSCGLPVITSDNGPMNEFINPKTCQTITIKKFYCRNDSYYWPMCEVNVNDLTKQMEWYVFNNSKINELKFKTRKFAEEKLEWMNNQELIDSIFLEVKLLPKENKLINAANIYDNRKYNIPRMVYIKYRNIIKNIIKKVLIK